MAKLYRLVLNGKLPSDVAARLVYILKEVRSTLEAEPPPALLSIASVGSARFGPYRAAAK